MSDGQLVIDTLLDTDGVEKGLGRLNDLVKTGMKAAVTAIAGVGTALAGAAGYAVKVGSDFEAGMSEVAAISGATGDELAALTSKAKEMGANTKFSATESAEAFKYMAMAGWNASQMTDGIAGIMDLAAASGEDLASVSDIVTDALTAFGLQASDSGHFADVLAMASNKANTNVSMMGETFKYVAPVAGALGYKVEDMSVAIGLMANSGIKGSEAGTALRSVLSRMAKPTDDVQKAMSALGLSLTNSDGSMKSFNEVMVNMRKGFSGLNQEQKASYAAMLGGQEAMSGLLAIANASDTDFNNLTDAIADCDGAAANMADTMNDNLQGQVTLLKSAVEGLGIEVYEGLQVPLKNLAKQGSGYVNELSKAFENAGLDGLVGAIGSVFSDVVTQAAQAAPDMIKAAVNMIDSFNGGLEDNMDAVAAAGIDIAKSLIGGVGDIAESFASLAAKAAQSLVNNLFSSSVSKKFTDFTNAAKKSFQSMQQSMNRIFGKMVIVIGNFTGAVSDLGKVVLPILAKAIKFVADNFNILLPLISSGLAIFKTYTIVSTIAVNIGKFKAALEGATIAQNLLNLALSAGPWGAVAMAIAGVTTALAVLSFEKPISETERLNDQLKKADENLGSTFEGIGKSTVAFSESVKGATSIFQNFDDSVLMSAEHQQALSDEMDSVQSEITSIAQTATNERRDLTQSEITRLDELFEQMHSIAGKEAELSQAKLQVVQQEAQVLADTHSGTAAEYEEYSARLIKSAEETKDGVVSNAQEQYTTELALISQTTTQGSDEYNQRVADAQAARDSMISAAQEQCAGTYSTLSDGYAKNSEVLQTYNANLETYNSERNSLQSNYDAEMERLQDEYNAYSQGSSDENLQQKAETKQKMEDLSNHYKENMARIENEHTADLDEETQHQLGIWADMESGVELYGGQSSEQANTMVTDIMSAFDKMPDETKEKMQHAMSPMLTEMQNAEPSLYDKATGIANGILSRLSKAFDIHSPSRKVRKIFNFVMKGAEVGMDDETDNLYKQTNNIAQNVMESFNGANIDTSGLVARMQEAVNSETAQLGAKVATTVNYTNAKQEDSTDSNANDRPIVVESHLNINGREFAKATTPYISEQLTDDIRGRK